MINWKWILFIGTVASLLVITDSSNSCKIKSSDQDYDSTFLFFEVPENYEVGKKLPGSFMVEFEDGNLATQSEVTVLKTKSRNIEQCVTAQYVNHTLDETGLVEFYLTKSLREYHLENHRPNIEYVFYLSCLEENIPYTYMITIEDANLHSPHFSDSAFFGFLNQTIINGYKIQFESNTTRQKGIHVMDPDFNRSHANITLSCEGKYCSYFTFTPIHTSAERGHVFYVDVSLTKSTFDKFSVDVQNGTELEFTIKANDSLNTCTTRLSLQVNLEAPNTRESDFPVNALVGAGSAIVLVLMSCSIAIGYLILKRRKAKDILRQLTEAEIREFLDGTANFSGDGSGKRSVDVNTPIISLPYNRDFEIPREKLKIDETTILGTGAFGIVWKGLISMSNGDGITVAVKSVKRNVGVLYFKALLSELKIMAYIGKHQNIVSLVGACTHNIQKREVYIALQYCANGNFHNYLKCRRDRFSNMVVDGNLRLRNTTAYSFNSFINSTRGSFSKTISTLDLLKWATQIANGLQYLESKSVIHGDLATRNILLDSNRVAKIGDFGLSRRLIDYSNYYEINSSQSKGSLSKTPLPWKWMSPESLKDLKFSKKSDIWSFGMVLWEIFTLGQTPYPGLNWDPNFVERLEKGMRPWKPSFATTTLFDIMCDCWNLDPFDRPNILDIKRSLENITLAAFRQMGVSEDYIRLAENHSYMILLNEDQDGYLNPNHVQRNAYIEI